VDLLTEECYLQASAGLIFEYKAIEKELPEENSERIEQVATSLGIKTGFNIAHEAGVVLSFVNDTRTFTITPEGSTFEYWIKGVKYTKTTADSVVIDDTEGLWYIYYVGTVLTTSQVEWVIKDGDKALVSIIHWDATNNTAIYLAYEVHSFDMSPADHSYLHRTIGTNFVSGLGLVEGVGGDDGKVAMDSGECRDEDIHIDITDGVGTGLFEQELGNTTVFAAAQIPVYYRSGATAWRKYTTSDYPFYDNSGADNVHYNSYSAPNWASTAAGTTAKYIACWIFATNNIHEPIVSIMGQVESSTLNAAKEANTLEGFSFGTLPFEEMKILYRLIFKSDSSHAHTLDMRSVANVPGGTYVPQPTLQYYIDALLHIGAGNSGWKNLPFAATHIAARGIIREYFYATGGDDPFFIFDIPIDHVLGAHNLVINTLKISLYAADDDDFITGVIIYGWTAWNAIEAAFTDATDKKTPQELNYDLEDLTIGGVYERIVLQVQCTTTSVLEQLKIGYVQLEYYYT